MFQVIAEGVRIEDRRGDEKDHQATGHHPDAFVTVTFPARAPKQQEFHVCSSKTCE